jgi:hypothetical protein
MYKLIMELIKHLESKGDTVGINICIEIGDKFASEFKSVNKAFDNWIHKRKK